MDILYDPDIFDMELNQETCINAIRHVHEIARKWYENTHHY